MSGLGMPVQQPAGFGTYFDKPAAHYILKPQFAATLRPEQINIISTAYTFLMWNVILCSTWKLWSMPAV